MEKLASIQALRGYAVLMVCAMHFLGVYNPHSPEWLKSIVLLGHHGVTMFFVISGFVLPLALSRADYSLAAFPRFALKRLVRLEPPYLVTIAVVVLLNIAASKAPGFQGRAPEVDVAQIAAHVGYIAPIVGKPWIVGVFWSLLVEVQFYILIGLTYAIFRKHPIVWIVALAIPAAFASDWQYLPVHLPVFLIGTTAFAWRAGMLRDREALALVAALAAFISFYRTPQHAAFALVAAGYILFARRNSRAIVMVGTISYSLYLIHAPFGVKTIHLVDRVTDNWILAAAAGFVAAFAAAVALWYLVERPAMRWASRIGYRSGSLVEPRRQDEQDPSPSRAGG